MSSTTPSIEPSPSDAEQRILFLPPSFTRKRQLAPSVHIHWTPPAAIIVKLPLVISAPAKLHLRRPASMDMCQIFVVPLNAVTSFVDVTSCWSEWHSKKRARLWR